MAPKQLNRQYSTNPESVKRRERRWKQKQAAAARKRRSAAARLRAREREIELALRQQQLDLEQQRLDLFSGHSQTIKQVFVGHNQILSQPSLNAAATSDNSIFHPPASIEISSKVGTEEPSLGSEDSSTLSFLEEDATVTQYSHEETPSSYSDCGAAALDGPIPKKRQHTPSSYLDCGAAALDGPIPKRQRRMESLGTPRFRLSDAFKGNPRALLGKKLADFDFCFDVVFDVHSQFRLRVRGGITARQDALDLMKQGTIVENSSPAHHGLMVLYRDWRGVEHWFPLRLLENGQVLTKTYITQSPFKTDPKYRHRRNTMLLDLEWLSVVLGVPFPLIGEYIARNVENLHGEMLYCPGLPEVMDVIERILPTDHETDLLCSIPYASEMGEPENWVVAIGSIRNVHTKVATMRRHAWEKHEIEKEDWIIQ